MIFSFNDNNGLGENFCRKTIDFIKQRYPTVNKIELSVASFNQRAYRVYEKIGFIKTKMSEVEINEQKHMFINMECYID